MLRVNHRAKSGSSSINKIRMADSRKENRTGAIVRRRIVSAARHWLTDSVSSSTKRRNQRLSSSCSLLMSQIMDTTKDGTRNGTGETANRLLHSTKERAA